MINIVLILFFLYSPDTFARTRCTWINKISDNQEVLFDKKLKAIKPKIIKSCAQPICTGLAYCENSDSRFDIPYTTLLTCKKYESSKPLECPSAYNCYYSDDKDLKVNTFFPSIHVDKKEAATTTPNEAKVN